MSILTSLILLISHSASSTMLSYRENSPPNRHHHLCHANRSEAAHSSRLYCLPSEMSVEMEVERVENIKTLQLGVQMDVAQRVRDRPWERSSWPITTPTTSPTSSEEKLTMSEFIEIKRRLRLFQEMESQIGPLCLRFAFHDCADRCDGHADMSIIDNKGLEDIQRWLSWEHKMYGGRHLSRADFTILCAIVAAETGIEYHNRNSTACIKKNKGCMPKPEFRFMYGRRDWDEAVDNKNLTDEEKTKVMPKPFFHAQQTVDYFYSHFNLTAAETVALLGAHSLGGMNVQNSGYNGAFSMDPFQFNLQYYHYLTYYEWMQFDLNKLIDPALRWNATRIQWMMIYFKDDKYLPNAMNVDIALKKDLSGVKYGDFVQYEELEDNSITSRWVSEFARNAKSWTRHFAEAMFKMSLAGNQINELKEFIG